MVRTPSIDEVNAFVNDPEIYEACKNDECPDPLVMPDPGWVEYYGLYLPEMVGLICLHPRLDGIEIHLSMKKGFRCLAREFVSETIKGRPIVYANIPEYLKTTINLAKKLGFQSLGYEGVFNKNSVAHRMELLCRR